MKRVKEFVAISVLLDDEELRALDGGIQMTQELFNSIESKLYEIGAYERYYRFIMEYPDFLCAAGEMAEKEIVGIEAPAGLKEEIVERLEGGA